MRFKKMVSGLLACALAVTSVFAGNVSTAKAEGAAAANDAAEASTALQTGGYYIMNTKTGRFLNAGNNYYTQASALTYGQLMTVTVAGSVSPDGGTYTIDSHFTKSGKHFMGANAYLDSQSTNMIITSCGNGSYTIVNEKGEYLTASEEAATKENTVVTFVPSSDKSDLSEWRFLTSDGFKEYAKETVAKGQTVDVTSLIFDPDYGFYNDYESRWGKKGTNYKEIGTALSGDNTPNNNKAVEAYHQVFDCTQTIEGVPNGEYTFSVQGFYRNDGGVASYYINEKEAPLMLITDEPQEAQPSSLSTSAQSFQAGNYVNTPITVDVINNQIKVGVKSTNDKTWVAWDNFNLKLVRLISDEEIAARPVIALIDKIGTVSLSLDSKRKIDAAREAFDNLSEDEQAYVTNVEKLTNAETALWAFINADGVIDKIEKIGTVELTDACKARIEEARTFYDLLTDEQKEIVGDKEEILTTAENQFQSLIPEQQVVADDKYYIVNTQTGGLLNGGNNYGTKASALTYGQLMSVKLLEGDTYHYSIQTHIHGEDEYLTAEAWTDQAAAPLVIAKTANGTFTIANASGGYLSANDANTVLNFGNKTKYSEWLILTREEYIQKVLKDAKNGPVDVTTLIFDSNFSRNNTYISEWEYTRTADGDGHKTAITKGGAEDNFCAEVYHTAFKAEQTITGIPNGKYQVTVQGFCRLDNGSVSKAEFYAGDSKGELMDIAGDPSVASTPGSMTDASNCFTAGAYVNGPIEVTVDNKTLTVGVSTVNTNSWVIWDNVTLKLIEVADSEYVDPVIALITAIGSLDNVVLTDDCKAKIDAAQAAYDELNDTQKGKVTNAQTLKDAATKYADLGNAAEVEELIDAIGDYKFTTSCKNKIDAAREAFDDLSEVQQGYVAVEKKTALETAEATYASDLETNATQLAQNDADEVVALIEAIPAPEDIELTDKAVVEAARKAFTDLSPEAKALVSDEAKAALEAAEEKIKEIEEAADMAVVNEVLPKIEAIGAENFVVEFTSDCRLAIEAAEKAYESLSEKQQSLMDEHYPGKAAKIPVARTAYDALVTENAPIIADGDYYIVNKLTGTYLNANAQIKARAASYGQLMTLAAEDDKVSYTVDSHYKVGADDHYLTADGSLGGEATALMIENSKDGNINITNENDQFLTANARGTVTFAATKTEGSEWMLLTRDELIDKLSAEIEEDSPADVTSLIFDPGIDEKNEYYDTKWIGSSDDKPITKDGAIDNRNIEVYQGIFDFSQTIEDIPNGVYELTVQGFYRPDGADAASAVPPVYYANDEKGDFMLVYDQGKTSSEGGWNFEREERPGIYVPNGMETASQCFSTGAYTNEPVTVVVRDNELTIGVKATDAISWVIWDNFQLKLKKVMTDADFAAEVEALIDAIDEVTAESGEAIKAAQAAFEALTEEQQALVSKDKLAELEAKATEYEDITADPTVVAGLKDQVTNAVAEAEAEALVEADYTAESWTAYDNALKALQALAQNPDAKKSQLEKALNDFKKASDELEVKEESKPTAEDTGKLTTAVSGAADLNEADYVKDENWTAFKAALEKAQKIQDKPNATKAQVQKAAKDLNDAIAKLTPAGPTVEPADKTALDKAIKDYAGLKKEDYTAATWTEYEKALNVAKEVSKDPNATKKDVEDALNALNSKKNALKPAPKVVKVSKITITADYSKVAPGKKANLKAAVKPDNATNTAVAWSVDKNAQKGKYASINTKGVLTTKSKAAGKTITVTATAKDGSGTKKTIKIKVMKGAVKKVSLKASSKKVKVKKKLTIKATVKTTTKKKSDANTKLTWKTSNKKIATVSAKGVVTGKKAGKVTITATSTDGTKKSAKIKLTVVKK